MASYPSPVVRSATIDSHMWQKMIVLTVLLSSGIRSSAQNEDLLSSVSSPVARAFIRVQEEEGATVVGYTEEKPPKHSASKRTKALKERRGDRPRPSRNSGNRKQRAHKKHRRHRGHHHRRRQKHREDKRRSPSSSCPSSSSSSYSSSSSSSVEDGEERRLEQKRRSSKSIDVGDGNGGDDDTTYHENVLRVVKENERLKQQLEEMKKRMELMSRYLRQQSGSRSLQASAHNSNRSNANFTNKGGRGDGAMRLRTGEKRKATVGGGAGDSSSLDENVPIIDYTPFSEQSLQAIQAEQFEMEQVRQRIQRRINEGRVYKGQIGFYPTEEEKEKQKKEPDYVDPSKPSAHDLYKAQKKEERKQGLGGMRYGLIKEDGEEDPNHEADVFHASQDRKMGQSVYQDTMEKIRTERSQRGAVRDRMDMGNKRALQEDMQGRINGPIWGGSTSDYS